MVKLSEYELKRGGLKFVLLIAIETLKAELTKQFFLMANFIISLVDLIIGTLAYFYLAIFIGEAMNRYITAYGMSYAEYLLIGILGIDRTPSQLFSVKNKFKLKQQKIVYVK